MTTTPKIAHVLVITCVFVASLINGHGQVTNSVLEKAAVSNSVDKASKPLAIQTDAKAPAKSWYSPIKNIPLGPGKLDIGGDIRTRYEFSDNFDVRRYGTETADNLLLQRTRLNFDYKFANQAHAFVEFQDARYWLSDLDRSLWPVNCPFYDEFDVRQAYAEWKVIGDTPLGFKAGRQSISYADKRVFGPGEWGNVGRFWWDAAKIYLTTDPVQVDLLYGQRVVSEPMSFNDEHFPYQMFGSYAQFKKLTWDKFSLKSDLFYLVQYDDHGNIVGENGKGDQQTHSVGFYFDGQYDKNWDFSGTLAGQLGKYGRDDIRAYGANAKAGYTFEAAWSPRIGGEFTYASGDGNATDGVHSTFDGIFGAVDIYY